jgi:hypothetical protein
MAYVDRSLADHEVVRYRVHVPDVRSWVARAHLRIGGFLLFAGFFLGYLAVRRGATSSASMLAVSALAVAGAILYENWISDIALSNHGLICGGTWTGRSSTDFPVKPSNDARLHREIFARLFDYAPRQPVASVPPIPRRA